MTENRLIAVAILIKELAKKNILGSVSIVISHIEVMFIDALYLLVVRAFIF